MDSLRLALWTIERRLAEPVGLDDLAAASGLSRRHLTRTFPLLTGRSVMGYMRARRLTEAAKALAAGEADVLGTALAYGYASHEAFTRAFAAQFGVPPRRVRRAGVEGLRLQEPLSMSTEPSPTLAPPDIRRREAFLVAGLDGRYVLGRFGGIPEQWSRFSAYAGSIAGPNPSEPRIAYGVSHDFGEDGTMSYLSGVEVTRTDDLPAELIALPIPAADYAVFRHEGHVTQIGATWGAVFASGLPALGRSVAATPSFELMDERFDPATGEGTIEIWVPIEA